MKATLPQEVADARWAAQAKVVGVVSFYFVVSISLVFLNKFMLSSAAIRLDAPLFLTWTQIVVACGCCYLISLFRDTRLMSFFPITMQYDLKVAAKVAPLTALFLAMIVCNNLCLRYVEISFYQVVRALTIVFNLVFTYTVLKQRTSRMAVASCGVVVVGYLMACQGEINFSVEGVIFGVASSLFVCLYSIYVKKILALVDNDHNVLMVYNNLNALWMLPIVVVLAGEVEAIRTYSLISSPFFLRMTLITGVFGFLINIATFLQISVTSPLTHNVSGTAKACVQTVLGAIVYKNEVSFQAGLGTFLSIIGCGMYSVVRYLEMPAKTVKVDPPKLAGSAIPMAPLSGKAESV